MIYLLHGFGGSVETSELIQTLMKNIQSYFGIGICPISYPSTDAKATHDLIKSFVDEDDDEKIFIGVSLGGFWARYFANQYPNSKLIMINPALNAPTDLQQFTKTGLAGFPISLEFCNSLKPYQITTDNNNIAITVIVCNDDEIINPNQTITKYKNRGDLFVTVGGHRLKLNDAFIDIINNAINDIAG